MKRRRLKPTAEKKWSYGLWTDSRQWGKGRRKRAIEARVPCDSEEAARFVQYLRNWCPLADVRSAVSRLAVAAPDSEAIADSCRLSEYVAIGHPFCTSPLPSKKSPVSSDETSSTLPLAVAPPIEVESTAVTSTTDTVTSVAADVGSEDSGETEDRQKVEDPILEEWYILCGRVSALDWLLWRTHRVYWIPMVECFSQVCCVAHECDCCSLSRDDCLALCIEAASLYSTPTDSGSAEQRHCDCTATAYFKNLYYGMAYTRSMQEPRDAEEEDEGHCGERSEDSESSSSSTVSSDGEKEERCEDWRSKVPFGMRVLSRFLAHRPWMVDANLIDCVLHGRGKDGFKPMPAPTQKSLRRAAQRRSAKRSIRAMGCPSVLRPRVDRRLKKVKVKKGKDKKGKDKMAVTRKHVADDLVLEQRESAEMATVKLSDDLISADEDSSDSSSEYSTFERESMTSEPSMTIEALVHSVFVLTTAHAMASLMQGLLLAPEWDASHDCLPFAWPQRGGSGEESSGGCKTDSFGSEATASAFVLPSAACCTATDRCLDSVSPTSYETFDDTGHSPLHTRTFNWRDGAYSVASRYCPALTNLLDDSFSVAFSMTDDSAAGVAMDTVKIREAMRHCVDRMFGVDDDRYDYAQLNKCLTISTKTFIKNLVTDPCRMRLPEMAKCKLAMGQIQSTARFSDEEIVHIAILAIESKRQTTITHALKAVYDYLATVR